MASQPVTGKTSPSSSYCTSPTSCWSCSRVRSALSSSAVRGWVSASVMSARMVCAVPVVQQSGETLCNLSSEGPTMDALDATVVHLFAAEPRIGVLEASRRLGVARGTVQARLDRLVRTGVISGWGPDLQPEALGHPVTAFLTLEIRQGAGHDSVAEHLARIPEVLEAVTITGAGDMWARVVARSNTDLQRVIDAVLSDPRIVRSSTVIALATQIPYRVLPLLDAVAAR